MCGMQRFFHYDKAMILNAAYDALDAIGFSIVQANSSLGALSVAAPAQPNAVWQISILAELPRGGTLVEVFPGDDAEDAPDWAAAFLDEIEALLESAGMEETK